MAKQKSNAVDQALNFPHGDAFEARLNELMASEDEAALTNTVIAVLDIDHFMRVDDNFGYELGDRILIETATFVKDRLPECATIYRIGGDEFGIIFTGEIEKEEVFLLMESIRKEYDYALPDGDPLTISVGIATAFDDASRPLELMRMAESALFRGKFAGRNKVCLAREEKMVPKTSHYTNDQLKRLTKLSKREGIGEAVLLREALDMLLKKYDL